MIKVIINTTTKTVQSIINGFGATPPKKKDSFFKSIAKDEIDKIIASQKKLASSNNGYTQAGFRANNITSMIVQNQLIAGV